MITHPKDYSGEMEGKHSQTLKLSKVKLLLLSILLCEMPSGEDGNPGSQERLVCDFRMNRKLHDGQAANI